MQAVESAPSIAVAILIIPVFDTARVFAIRIINGKSPFSPDKNHVHHILIRTGLNQVQTVLVLAALNIGTIVAAMALAGFGDNFLLLFYLIYFLAFILVLELLSRKFQRS
jgi:hypothetical protein